MNDIEKRIKVLECAVGILLEESPDAGKHYDDKSFRELNEKALRHRRDKELQNKIQADLMSINGARAELGLKPIDGGDILLKDMRNE